MATYEQVVSAEPSITGGTEGVVLMLVQLVNASKDAWHVLNQKWQELYSRL